MVLLTRRYAGIYFDVIFSLLCSLVSAYIIFICIFELTTLMKLETLNYRPYQEEISLLPPTQGRYMIYPYLNQNTSKNGYQAQMRHLDLHCLLIVRKKIRKRRLFKKVQAFCEEKVLRYLLEVFWYAESKNQCWQAEKWRLHYLICIFPRWPPN